MLRGLDLNVKRQWVLEMLRWELGPVSAGVPVAGMPGVTLTCNRQGLTLVHYSAQPEPFLSLELNNYAPKSAYVELNSARVSPWRPRPPAGGPVPPLQHAQQRRHGLRPRQLSGRG